MCVCVCVVEEYNLKLACVGSNVSLDYGLLCGFRNLVGVGWYEDLVFPGSGKWGRGRGDNSYS